MGKISGKTFVIQAILLIGFIGCSMTSRSVIFTETCSVHIESKASESVAANMRYKSFKCPFRISTPQPSCKICLVIAPISETAKLSARQH